MASFYEGPPIIKMTFCLTKETYRDAYVLKENYQTNFHRRGVKSVSCLILLLSVLAAMPAYYIKYRSLWFLGAVSLILAALLFFFWVLQPRILQREGEQIFLSNFLLGEETTVLIYRDSMEYQNAYEKSTYYWTDFEKCIENKSFFIFSGADRSPLILQKNSEQNFDKLSEHLSDVFTYRFLKLEK